MKPEEVRNLTDDELRHQQRELSDQLFKLKFQLNMGQTESLKKIRDMRKDIARIKTIARESRLPRPAQRRRSKPWPKLQTTETDAEASRRKT